VIRRIEESKATNNDVAHVDKAIPGGFRAQFPDFAVHAFNQAPVPGVPGIPSTFRQWDAIEDVPARVPALAVPLGYLGTDVTGGSSGHHLEGCRYQPGNGYVPCVADMAPRTGTKSVGFSLSGGADDASWTLRWGLESPEVGFVDAGDDECNVHIWGYFDAEAEVRQVPRATFMGTAPFTVTFAGSGSAPQAPNNTNATVNLEWSYSLTLQRVG
jgi:hypothetical protein